jgi:hypothetical protein
MDKVQKHNSFNTNIPSSESYRNHVSNCTVIFTLPDVSQTVEFQNIIMRYTKLGWKT